MENLIRQGLVQNPIFTVTLKDSDTDAIGRGGHFTFGYLDQKSYVGDITYAAVNTSQGFWQINSGYFKIGRNGNPIPRSQQTDGFAGQFSNLADLTKANSASQQITGLNTLSQGLSVADGGRVAAQVAGLGQETLRLASNAGGLQQLAMPFHPAIIDTGTTLMLIDDMTLLTIYNQIPGAAFNQSVGGYTVPCSTTSPDTFYLIGDQFFGIPGSSLPFAPLGAGICYGGIQSRGSLPMDI